MPLYVILYKFTDQGRKTIKDSPKRLRDATTLLEKTLGAKVLHALYTTGRYDLVVVTEAQSEEAALTGNAIIASAGNVTSETLHAYTVDQMEKIVGKLP